MTYKVYRGTMVGLFVLCLVLGQLFPTERWIPALFLGITAVSAVSYVAMYIYIRRRNERAERVRIE